jgi:hypothetical protein
MISENTISFKRFGILGTLPDVVLLLNLISALSKIDTLVIPPFS